ncbi:MAG: helix-turn-helix domain-containing protein [Lentisphaerales bacterium]|nr:helix-turn-helix domain-containing protein [Lentisphaerales bacterium]
MSKNARRGDQKTPVYIRNQAVKAVIDKGQKPVVVADVFGVALNTVYRWVRMYKSSGCSVLKDKKRGCHKGS